jgi:hypothetical protein
MADRPHTNDLFELFPDLPWPRPRGAATDRARIEQQVGEARTRADVNLRHQKASRQRLRDWLSTRRRR